MSKTATRLLRNLVIGFAIGGLIGAVIAHLGIDDGFRSLGAEDHAALLIATMLLCAGGFTGWAVSNPDRFKRVGERRDDADPADMMALQVARRSAISMVLAGAMFAIPPLVAANDVGETARILAAAGVLALLAIETVINWRLWRDGDELTRAVIVSTGAVCFWGAQFVLFIWAALAKLALIPDIGSWTMITALMAVYLVASAVIGVRRGFA